MRMKGTFTGFVCMVVAAWLCKSAFGDIVTFNSPGQWLTERSDKIVLKVQLDTSKIPQKKVAVVLSKMEGGKKKVLANKTFKVTDYSQEFALGSAGSSLLGGKDFLKIEWSLPGAKDKGSLFPVGIVDVDKLARIEPLHAAKTAAAVDQNSVADLCAKAKFQSLKGCEFALFWSPKVLSIVCKKGQGGGIVRFAFDGKNGKNAFISYSDRVVDLFTAKDSINAFMHNRVAVTDSISYPTKPWETEIKTFTAKDFAVVNIPLYDIGLVGQDDRVIGFSAYSVDEKGTSLAAYPEKAKLLLPGSWSSVVFDK
jgi:hypothetical protein